MTGLHAVRGHLPGVHRYFLLLTTSDAPEGSRTDEVEEAFPWHEARRRARQLALDELGDPEAFTLLYNGARTRRCPWPHVHVLLARTVSEKRWALLCFHLKHLTRWRRWPLLRRLFAARRALESPP